jgi:hypothetical protein
MYSFSEVVFCFWVIDGVVGDIPVILFFLGWGGWGRLAGDQFTVLDDIDGGFC